MAWTHAVTALLIGLLGCSALLTAGTVDRTDGDWSVVLPPLLPGAAGTYVKGPHSLSFVVGSEPFVQADGSTRVATTILQERDDISVWTQLWGAPTPDRRKAWFVEGTQLAGLASDHGEYAGVFARYGANETRLYGEFQHFMLHFGDHNGPLCGLIFDRVLDPTKPWHAPSCPHRLSGARPHWDAAAGAIEVSAGPVRLTFHPDLPVPLTVDEGEGVWELTGYSPGSVQGAASSTPTWPVAVTHQSIPDESGITHVFPLSQALVDARQAIPRTSLADALARPGFYLANARFTEWIDEGARHLQWHLTASDGVSSSAVTVTRSAPQGDETLLGTPLVPRRSIAPAPVSVIADAEPPEGPFAVGPQPWLRLARLEPLAARWHASGGTAEGAPSWGFTVACGSTCDEAAPITWYGRHSIRGVQKEVRGAACLYDCPLVRELPRIDLLAVDSEGTSVWRELTSWRIADQAYYVLGTATVHAESVGPPLGSASDPTGAGAWKWQRPGPGLWVGAVTTGVIAAALWYATPALKLALAARASPQPEHPLRRSIRDAVASQPGIHLHALERLLGQPTGTIRHHLHQMESGGMLSVRRSRGYACYFLARGTDHRLADAASALKAPTAIHILMRTLEGPLTMSAAAACAGVTPGAATHHVERLEQAGLIQRHRSGRYVELHPTALAEKALTTLAT